MRSFRIFFMLALASSLVILPAAHAQNALDHPILLQAFLDTTDNAVHLSWSLPEGGVVGSYLLMRVVAPDPTGPAEPGTTTILDSGLTVTEYVDQLAVPLPAGGYRYWVIGFTDAGMLTSNKVFVPLSLMIRLEAVASEQRTVRL